MVRMTRVSESLGSSSGLQHDGAFQRVVEPEEVALTACHEAPRAMELLFRVADGGALSESDSIELGVLVGRLRGAFEQLGTIDTRDTWIPVSGPESVAWRSAR